MGCERAVRRSLVAQPSRLLCLRRSARASALLCSASAPALPRCSQAMLNRFIQAKKDAAAPEKERRPWKASDVSEVPIAEKWRNSVIREIAKGVADIQNATLGEHAIRELGLELVFLEYWPHISTSEIIKRLKGASSNSSGVA